MHGLINRFVAHPGRRDELVAAMTSEAGELAGCLSFVVAHDPSDPDAVWITEVWESRAAWEASMERPGVKASIAASVPLVRDWGTTVATVPVAIRGL